MARLLVIDDEVDLCELIAELAEDRGVVTRTIHDGSALGGAMADFAPDAIMLDLMMPGIDGVELLRTVADKLKGVKIVLMSGSDARVLNSARRLGQAHGLDVVGTLEKPIEVAAIRQTVDQLFANGGESAPPATATPAGTDLARAIAEGEIRLNYQPIVKLATGEALAVEALARWAHPQGDMVPPLEFVATATEDGLLAKLTHHIFGQAVRQLAQWQKQGLNLSVHLNVNAALLTDPSLADHLFALCDEHQVNPASFTLDLPEIEAMREIDRTLDVLSRLKLRKVGIAIDDFGSGRSSIRDLQKMPLTALKIGRGFVKGLPGDEESRIVVQSIVSLAHSLKLQAGAVGIGDEAALAFLKESACDWGQGHVFTPPLAEAELSSWLAARKG